MDDKKEIESANNQPAKAIDVARYLIGLAQNDGKPVDNLRLQKLLYYVGELIGITNNKSFLVMT